MLQHGGEKALAFNATSCNNALRRNWLSQNMDAPLYKFVTDRLSACKGRWPGICEETGIGYSWLSKMMTGAIPDPGVHRLQQLADYFNAKDRAEKFKRRAKPFCECRKEGR